MLPLKQGGREGAPFFQCPTCTVDNLNVVVNNVRGYNNYKGFNDKIELKMSMSEFGVMQVKRKNLFPFLCTDIDGG